MIWNESMLNSNRWLSQPRKGGPIYLRLTYPSLKEPGKSEKYRVSLGTSDMAQARRIRNKYVVPIMTRWDTDLLACRKLLVHFLKEIDAAAPDLPKELDEALGVEKAEELPQPPSSSLSKLIQEYVSAMENPDGFYSTAPSTAKRYASVYRSFLAHAGDIRISTVDDALIEEYLEVRLSTDNASKKTLDLEILALRRLFRYALKKKKVQTNPAKNITILRTRADRIREKTSGKRRCPTHEEIDLICTEFPVPPKSRRYKQQDYQDFALISRYTGMRQQEIAHLKVEDVRVEDQVLAIEVVDEPGRRTKTGTSRLIPVADKLREALQRRLDSIGTGPMFPLAFEDHGKYLGKLFCRYVKQIGTELVFHAIRHYANSEMANAGVAPDVRKQILGHSRRETHDLYTHLGPEVLKDAVDKIY